MQKLKSHWINGANRRLQRQLKLHHFLEVAKTDYMTEKNSNHVEKIWKKFLKKDVIKRKTEEIINKAIAKRVAIEEALLLVDKYAWVAVNDPDGGIFYYDTTKHEESTYEKPAYKFKHYEATRRLQRIGRIFLERLAELRHLKEESRQNEIAMMAKKMLISLQAVQTSVTFVQRDLDDLMTNGIPKIDDNYTIESLMPWTLRLSKISDPRPGIWALKQVKNKLGSMFEYESVLMFNITKSTGKIKCSIKNVKGIVTKNIDMNQLYEMNYEKELEIECRPKRQLNFYKGYISKIKITNLGEIIYNIRYIDGEYEEDMSREYIRYHYYNYHYNYHYHFHYRYHYHY